MALVGSVLLHSTFIAFTVGVLRQPAPAPAPERSAAADSTRDVSMLFLPPPAPSPTPARPVPPPATPPPPAAERRPRPPEHDEPEPMTPRPADERAPATPTTAPQAPSAPERPPRPDDLAMAAAPPAAAPGRTSDAASDATSDATSMESEARRLFGPRSRGAAGTTGPLATRGMETWLPENPDRCTPKPAAPRDPDAQPELATISGRIYREGTRLPLPGAHLQIIGTPYVTFADDTGRYDLRFDKTLVDECRTQYVRVTAPGFRAQMLVLSVGPQSSNDVPMRQR